MKFAPANYIRALRAPFLSASILPFMFGSLIEKRYFDFPAFMLGLFAVMGTHLGANLINDYADSRRGVDWKDKRYYGFFGGSKLIQEGVLSERFYLNAARISFCVAVISVIALSAVLRSFLVMIFYPAILFLSWSYSEGPLRLSYRRLGEIAVFILFGPVPVMGGYFIQTGVLFNIEVFLLSLPFGFLTAAILFANEVPDYSDDTGAGKMTWVSLTGPSGAYILYCLLMSAAFLSIASAIFLGKIGVVSALSFVLLIPVCRAAVILKDNYGDKTRLVESSKLTIMIQATSGVILILGAALL